MAVNQVRTLPSSAATGRWLATMAGQLTAGVAEVWGAAVAALERLAALSDPEDGQDRSLARALYLDSPDAYLILGGDKVVGCNRAAEALFGGKRRQIVGHAVANLLPPVQPDRRQSGAVIEAWLAEARRTGRAGGELESRRLDGAAFWGQVTVSPLGRPGARKFVVLWRDITVFHATNQRMRQLSQAVEQCPVSIVITDCEGKIEYVNRKFEEITGYRREEAIGQNPRVLKSGEQGPEVYRELWTAISAGGEWRGELHNRRKNGELYWENVSISALRQPDGRITHFLAVKEDIEARKRAEQEIQQTNAALEAALARTQEMTIRAEMATIAKSEFLARMSHEIRTPMNGVIGMTGLLLDTPLNETQRRFAEIVRNSADALLTIINDILDFSKIEAGKMTLEVVEFDLREIVTGTVEILAPRAQAKGVEFVCDVAAEVPAVVRGDPGRLRQIILNLTGNAIKFTEKGEVVLRVQALAGGDGRAGLRFEITDTGIGIPADKLGILFSAFTQVDGSNTRRFGGTGLGLAIAKQLAELMGGDVGVTSVVGRGSTFWFEVCLEAPGGGAGAGRPVAQAFPGLRVLVIDDNATNRTLVARWCRSRGCEVVEAADGQTATSLLQQAAIEGRPVQVALVDQLMPGMDGLEFGRQVRLMPAIETLALVLMAAPGQARLAVDAASGGFQEIVSKPILESALSASLARASGRPGPANFVPHESPSATSPGATALRGRVLVAEDNATNQLVALGVLHKLGIDVEVVGNGLEAVQRLATTHYDLVLMDCQMPEMNGYEATGCIRNENSPVRNHQIPVIAMTADAMSGAREECLAAGMNDYVTKPISISALAEVLERWLPKPGEGSSRGKTGAG